MRDGKEEKPMAKLLGCPTCGHNVAEGAPLCMNCGQQGPFLSAESLEHSAKSLARQRRARNRTKTTARQNRRAIERKAQKKLVPLLIVTFLLAIGFLLILKAGGAWPSLPGQ